MSPTDSRFSQIFPSGPLDYSSAEFKRNLNGYHLAQGYYFIAHGSHSHRFFPPDHLFFEHESNEICRRPTDQREVIFFIRTIGLFHPHGKSVSICEYLWETKIIIRVPKIFVTFELLLPFGQWVFDKSRVQRKNPCLSVSIRVPKMFDSCSKKIRVQKKQSAQVPHTNAEPRRTTFILSVMPGDYRSHLPTRPLPLPLHITSQPSCHSQYTYHEASC